jgi:hypothetical protein
MTNSTVIVNPLVKTALAPTPVFPSNDAFGRLRVSQASVLFDSKQVYDEQPLLWTTSTTGGASIAHRPNEASSRLTVSGAGGDVAIRQTRRVFNYNPGYSQLCLATFNMRGAVDNVEKSVGLFNAQNGIAYVLNGTTNRLFRLRSFTSGAAVDTDVPQASWNIDPLDGAGPSGKTLLDDRTNIFILDFEWLGVGSVRCGFVIDGEIIPCHQFQNANVQTLVYMSTPNLPVRYEIRNLAASAGSDMDSICSTVASEGGDRSIGQTFSADRGIAGFNPPASATHPLVAIRLQSGFLGPVSTIDISAIAPQAASFRWALIVDPSRGAGTAPSWTPVPNSQVEFDITSTQELTGGTQIATGYAAQGSNAVSQAINPFFSLGTDVAGNPDELVLAVQEVSGAGGDTYLGAINWLEF